MKGKRSSLLRREKRIRSCSSSSRAYLHKKRIMHKTITRALYGIVRVRTGPSYTRVYSGNEWNKKNQPHTHNNRNNNNNMYCARAERGWCGEHSAARSRARARRCSFRGREGRAAVVVVVVVVRSPSAASFAMGSRESDVSHGPVRVRNNAAASAGTCPRSAIGEAAAAAAATAYKKAPPPHRRQQSTTVRRARRTSLLLTHEFLSAYSAAAAIISPPYSAETYPP